ncbi:hypothetical protein PAMA_017256 [Pampus argenteus]
MALQMSALFSYVRGPLCTGPLPRVRTDIHFKHILTPGSPQLRGTPATSPLRGYITAASRAQGFSTTPAALGRSSPRWRAGWLRRVAIGAAFGVSAAALVKSLHTGTLAAMAQKVNLNSADGDWKETKVKDRRQYYRTSNCVPLEDVEVWTPTAVSAGSEQSRYPRNEKLDQKISLYSDDITKLEIDAIVNAGEGERDGGEDILSLMA